MRAAVSFLTPFGGSRAPGAGTLDWFPAVGAFLGLALGGLWWAGSRAWPAGVVAALVVVADLAGTGMLHLDGLLDAADGLLPPLSRDRRLAAMAAPEIGAFGATAGAATLIARWAALASLRASLLLLAGLWCLSRTAMAVVARIGPYAHDGGGLASAFVDPNGATRMRHIVPLVAGGLSALGLLLWWRPAAGAATWAAAIVGAGGVALLARRRIGGYTGDVLGACGVLAETAGLVVAAAKW